MNRQLKVIQLTAENDSRSDSVLGATSWVVGAIVAGELDILKGQTLDLDVAVPAKAEKLTAKSVHDIVASQEHVRCLPSTSLDTPRYTFLALQTSLGIYGSDSHPAGLVASFDGGPILGIIGRIGDAFYVVDVQRMRIEELKPLVGFSEYVKNRYASTSMDKYAVDILVWQEKKTITADATAEEEKPKKAKRKRPAKAKAAPKATAKKPKRSTRKKTQEVEEGAQVPTEAVIDDVDTAGTGDAEKTPTTEENAAGASNGKAPKKEAPKKGSKTPAKTKAKSKRKGKGEEAEVNMMELLG